MNKEVVIVKTEARYPEYPYMPSEFYPEFKNNPNFKVVQSKNNQLWDAVRNLLFHLGLDKENFGKDNWNPFGDLVKEGGTVLIKPNWVRDYNPINKSNIDSLVTHSSVIKIIIDYVLKAINYKGKIIIGDAPLQDCNFDNLLKRTKTKDLIEEYKKMYKSVDFVIEDWRLTVRESKSVQIMKDIIADRYRIINLGSQSFLDEISDHCKKFRVTCYNHNLMIEHHDKNKHEYLVTNRIFEADLIINLPKLKTHMKAGLTGALKNLIGINGHKEFLPHHIKGSYLEGGDNYMNPSFWKRIFEEFDEGIWSNIQKNSKFVNKVNFLILGLLWRMWYIFSKDRIFAGSWSGNETIWRTTLDLNHILYFYNPTTDKVENIPQRKVITIVDGIIAGQGEGPLTPSDKEVGIIIGGFNPAIIDAVIAKLIGYNFSRVPIVYNALFNINSLFALARGEKIFVKYFEKGKSEVKPLEDVPSFGFIPPKFWKRAMNGEIYRVR
jgi:uncharacterized protein (DUF362 family)